MSSDLKRDYILQVPEAAGQAGFTNISAAVGEENMIYDSNA
jgi:hypothetical protein